MIRELLHHDTVSFVLHVRIRSGDVCAAISEHHIGEATKDHTPTICYTNTEVLQYASTDDPEAYLRSLEAALKALTAHITKYGLVTVRKVAPRAHLNSVLVLYDAPWGESVARTIFSEKKDGTIHATDALIADLVAEADSASKMSERESVVFEETGLQVIHHSLGSVELNGYRVDALTGQECTSISATDIRDMAPVRVRNVMKRGLAHLVNHVPVVERASSSATAKVLDHVVPHMARCLLVTIGRTTTELSLIEHGVVLSTVTMMVGVHDIEIEVAESLNTIVSEARSHIRDYVRHTSREIVTKAIAEACDAYQMLFIRLCSDIQNHHALPSEMFVDVPTDYRALYLSIIERAYTSQNIVPATHVVDNSTVENNVVYDADIAEDAALSVSTLFFHIEQQNKIG
jgi:hypothetical protein